MANCQIILIVKTEHRADLSPCKRFQQGTGCMVRQPDNDDDDKNDDHVKEDGEDTYDNAEDEHPHQDQSIHKQNQKKMNIVEKISEKYQQEQQQKNIITNYKSAHKQLLYYHHIVQLRGWEL